ncbi:zinc-binding dehydrogenase [Streptomyces oryzae]|uniref:Zinc-binding dehydrogenase n=1 Tax=Streptomyces oryzae TaxID=1434886 RepID=A0ABS3XBF7_9ACTN|nr:zinc-binding dehydrogenase [Streptomyces oryzae]MBO8192426.1 zinc-binding dehydrogenase [Streptomyces oryzae]
MHAVVLHTFGPAENLRYETLPDPEPGPGQVRISVRAAGVHAIETVLRAGVSEGLVPPLPELPAVFGGEVSGTVDAVGPDVDRAWLGRDVVTASGAPGGYAELAVADVAELLERPAALGHEAAVAALVTGATTVGVLAQAEWGPQDVVLVNSAAGGMGRLLVQHFHALGAVVIGAAGGPAKAAAVRALGTDLAVDYNLPDWQRTVADWLAGPAGGRSLTAVLDGVGGEKARTAFGLLGGGGRFVTYGAISGAEFTPSADELAARGLTHIDALRALLAHPERIPAYRAEALARTAAGEFTHTTHPFPLAEAAGAHKALEQRETTGKVVLIP